MIHQLAPGADRGSSRLKWPAEGLRRCASARMEAPREVETLDRTNVETDCTVDTWAPSLGLKIQPNPEGEFGPGETKP